MRKAIKRLRLAASDMDQGCRGSGRQNHRAFGSWAVPSESSHHGHLVVAYVRLSATAGIGESTETPSGRRHILTGRFTIALS